MSLPQELTLQRLPKVGGEIYLPGSKSISNRALLVASMAQGKTRLRNLLDSDDTQYMLRALRQLGVDISITDQPSGTCEVVGCAGPLVTQPRNEQLQLGMAGTAYRPLAAALCLGKGSFELLGNARMQQRPIGHLVDALRQMGGQLDYLRNSGYPPLRVEGTGLAGGVIRMRGDISSQFLTSILLSAPLADAELRIEIEGEQVSKPYLDITLGLMRRFGAKAEHDNYQTFRVTPSPYRAIGDYLIEGDASNATYFLAAGAITGTGIEVVGLGRNSVQGDIAFTEVLRAMGAAVSVDNYSVRVAPGELRAIDLDLNHIPDAAMTVAVLALFAKGTSTLRNLYNLRVKETDRLTALATELRKVGATVIEGQDFLTITPPAQLRHAEIDTYDDHRMAMCFSLLALGGVPVTLRNPGCVGKTFPGYFEAFAKVAAASV